MRVTQVDDDKNGGVDGPRMADLPSTSDPSLWAAYAYDLILRDGTDGICSLDKLSQRNPAFRKGIKEHLHRTFAAFFRQFPERFQLEQGSSQFQYSVRLIQSHETNASGHELCDRVVQLIQSQGHNGTCLWSLLFAGEQSVSHQIKKKYGSIRKFFEKFPAIFRVSGANGHHMVRLLQTRPSVMIPHVPTPLSTTHDFPSISPPISHTGKKEAFTESSITLVHSNSSCSEICQILKEEKLIVLDCEGVNLGASNGSLCLIQIASKKYGTFLFDTVACDSLWDVGGLTKILEDKTIVKVIHDCRMDVVALRRVGVVVQSVFDTQLAFSFLNPGKSSQIGLGTLIKTITGKEHPEKTNAPHSMNFKAWSQRPLTQQAISYAVHDVVLLLEVFYCIQSQFCCSEDVEAVIRMTNLRISNSLSTFESNSGSSSASCPRICEVFARLNLCEKRSIEIEISDEFDELLEILPSKLSEFIVKHLPRARHTLSDVLMDLDRPVGLINNNGSTATTTFLQSYVVRSDDIQQVQENCGTITDSHRACIGNCLHRCSFMFDPFSSEIVGLSLRMARIVKGIACTVDDLLLGNNSVLLVGPPGSGKTTLLRDIACFIASKDRSVMIVDTNNEIAGESDVPHSAIGKARRMKVGPRSRQHFTMLEAVQNHNTQTLVIDEIGTSQEVREAVSVKQRGIQLIATCHGRTIADVLNNPDLRNLLGGINVVILSADERMKCGAPTKTRLERKMVPSFDFCIEMLSSYKWRIHRQVAKAVDVILSGLDGEFTECEIREMFPQEGFMQISKEHFPCKETVASLELLSNG